MPDNRICRRRILSEEYRDFIVSSRRIPPDISVPEEQLCRQTTEAGYDVVYVEQSQAEPLEFGRFTYGSVPRCYALLDMAAMEQAGVTAVQNYPTLELMGEQVMIGFVDTGIDYTHPAFRNLDGSTRIEGLWDQTQQDGDPPEGLSYGTGYSREEIDRALASGDPYAVVPSRDEDGHGTYIASLAAGGAGEEEQFLGAAPEAVIAAVRLKGAKQYLREFYCIAPDAVCFQENDIMLYTYIYYLARKRDPSPCAVHRPRSSLGGHKRDDAALPYAGILCLQREPGRFVTGTGNEAAARHHYRGVLQDEEDRAEGGDPRGGARAGVCGGTVDGHPQHPGRVAHLALRGDGPQDPHCPGQKLPAAVRLRGDARHGGLPAACGAQ